MWRVSHREEGFLHYMCLEPHRRRYEGDESNRVGVYLRLSCRSVLKTVWNAPYYMRFMYKRNRIVSDAAKQEKRDLHVDKPAKVEKKPISNRFAFLFDDDE